MSKRSDRYVRWFGTRLPVTSRTFLYGIMALLSLMLSFLTYFLLAPFGLVFYLLISAALGVAVHVALLALQRRRLEYPTSDEGLRELAARVHQKVAIPSTPELWRRESREQFIVSTCNALFSAVIVSDALREAMLAKPESGEALLAFHLIRLPKGRLVHDLVGSVMVFLLVAIIPVLLADVFSSMMFMVLIPVLFLAPLIVMMVFFIRPIVWRHEVAFEIVDELYGLHPQVAKIQVERGRDLDDDERRAVLWGVLEWEKNQRSARRVAVVMVAVFLSVVLGVSILFSSVNVYQIYLHAFSTLPVLGAAVGVVAYLIVRQWDKKAMREVEFATAGAREPIWMD